MQISANLPAAAVGQSISINKAQMPDLQDSQLTVNLDQGMADSFVLSDKDGKSFTSPFLTNCLGADNSPAKLPDEAPPKLQRPVLFLHGYMGEPQEFADMATWLARDGENKDGGVINVANLDKIDSEANMFALEYTKPYQPLATNAGEIKAAVEAICRATGCDSVDLVAHSKGGLDARAYMMDASERVDNVVTIGTPHKGTRIADLELFVREKLGHPVKPNIKDPMINTALHELSADVTKADGSDNNPTLNQLNDDWKIQRGRADYLAIAGSGVLTIADPGVTFKGDGVVPHSSASSLKGAEHADIKHQRHGSMPRNEQVMLQTAHFLTGDGDLEPDLYDREFTSLTAHNSDASDSTLGGFNVAH